MHRSFTQSFFALVFLFIPFVLDLPGNSSAGAVDAVLAEMPMRGLVRAVKKAEMSTGLAVRAQAIHVRVADAFKKGDVLVEFDCEQLEANRESLEATHAASEISLASQQRLVDRGAGGRHDLRLAEIQTQKSAAEVRALSARLKHCVVTAPFDGRVLELPLQEYETPKAGTAFMSLVGTGAYEIDLIVPSRWLAKVSPGTTFKLMIDETATAHTATVDRIGAAVDPVSQTIKVIATFVDPDEQVLPGMSGAASFSFATEVQ